MYRTDHTIGPSSSAGVTVRMATDDDAPALARVAALDSAAVPEGPALLAEIDGMAAAALPLAGGAAVADPFRRTAAAIELLELRAAQIRPREAVTGPGGSIAERLRALVRAPRPVTQR